MRLIYPKALWRGDKNKAQIYLTFDDGPIPDITPQVLSILQKCDVKATFFCIGDNVRKYPGLFKQLLEQGHCVGNHTFHHKNGLKSDVSAYLTEVQQCAEYVKSKLFRPPYGKMKRSQYREIKRQNFQIVMWDVLAMDYDQRLTSNQCKANVLNNCRNGSVIVFHDSVKASKNVLPILEEIIDELKKKYHFATLEEFEPDRAIM